MAASVVEQIQGILPSARVGLSDFDLIVTDRRLIGAKIGNSGVAGIAGGLIGTAISLSGQDGQRSKYTGMSVDQILGANNSNFEIPLASIEKGVFNGGISMVTMPTLVLWTTAKKMRFMFTHSMWKKNVGQVEQAKQLLSRALPGRIEFKRA